MTSRKIASWPSSESGRSKFLGLVAVIGACIAAISLMPELSQFALDEGSEMVVQRVSQRDVQVLIIIPLQQTDAVTAHYAEHLAWLNALGGARDADRHSNAWTSDTAVSYWLNGSPEDL